MKKIAFLLACALLSVSLCSCAIEPIAGTAPVQSGQQPAEPESQNKPDGMTDDGRFILCDNVDFLITVDSVKFGGMSDCEIVVTCENKSEMDLLFYCTRMTVNGWQEDIAIAETVSSGKSSSTALYPRTYDYLHYYGDVGQVYTSVDQLSFDFEVHDANELSNLLLDKALTAYVSDVSEENIDIRPRLVTDTETVVVDNEDFAFVVHGVYDLDDDIMDNYYMVHCYAENKTDKPLEIEWNNVSINGWMVDPHYYDRISPDSRKYCIITFDLDLFNRTGIEQLSSIEELSFEVRAFYQSTEECFDAAREAGVVHPAGLTAEEITGPQRTPVPGEQIIADDERFTLIVDPVVMPYDDTYCMGIYVHNRGEAEIHLSVFESAINDQRGNFHFGNETIPAGQSVYHLVTVDSSELTSAGEKSLETISCRVQILNELRAGIFSEQVSSAFEQ